MAHHASAEKRMRQQLKRRQRNRLIVASVRTYVKKVRAAVAGGNRDEAVRLLRNAASRLDRAVSKGTMHRKTAARTISRLSRAVAGL